MIIPSAYGPRSLTVHWAVAPFDALIVTTVPIGNVLWAHVPGGAASYHVAPPLWVRPEGAVEPDPDDPDPGLGAGFVDGEVAGFAAGLAVVVVRRGTVVDGVVRGVVVRTRATTAVDDVDGGTVDDGSLGTVVGTPPVACRGGSAPDADTATTSPRTCGGDDDGGAEAFISASAGAPAIAAQSATGTARRAFLNPRVVRTPPLVQNAGAARPPLQALPT